MITLEKVAEGCLLGEGPHWDVTSQNLYFVDISGKAILRYSHQTNKVTKVSLDKAPTFIIPVEGKPNQFVISLDNELTVVSWDGESDKISIVEKLATLSFNDAKCDSTGRLWAGALRAGGELAKTQPVGTLYSFDTKHQLKNQVGGIRVANGLAFNETAKKMFYIDSLAGTVDRFDFDASTGTLSNRQTWFTLSKLGIPGIPDGMTIDTDGNLWVAVFQGSRVLKVDGNKKETLLDTIDTPAEQVTSVTFGGPNLDELYVTTGNFEFQGKKVAMSANGATFRVTGTGAKGFPGISFKMN